MVKLPKKLAIFQSEIAVVMSYLPVEKSTKKKKKKNHCFYLFILTYFQKNVGEYFKPFFFFLFSFFKHFSYQDPIQRKKH